MMFLAIDIETTGLDPHKHSITEFAAILTNLRGTEPPKRFYAYMDPEGMVWSQYCLGLHAQWLSTVLEARKAKKWEANNVPIFPDTKTLIEKFTQWLFVECSWPVPKDGKWKTLVPAGKNFASFDRRFLDAAGFPSMFKHRTLDPMMLYVKPEDDVPPGLDVCKLRAIEQGCKFDSPLVAHTAMEDAEDVVKLLHHRFAKP